jgi:acyl-CoA thioesterase I
VALQSALNQREPSPIRVACIGDSITAGTEYPVDLWQLLGPNYVVGNFGIGGSTVTLGTNCSWFNQTAFPVAEEFNPNIAVIILGANDAATFHNVTNSGFIADYHKLIAQLQALPTKPKLYLVLPPPIFQNNASLSELFFVENVIPNIREVASDTGLPLVDAYTPLLDHSEYFPDGVHPDVNGARVIAHAVYDALNAQK